MWLVFFNYYSTKYSKAIFKSGYLNLKSIACNLFGITFCVSNTTVDIWPKANLKANAGTQVKWGRCVTRANV